MPLLEVEDLHVEFALQGATMHAVEGVSFTLDEGEVLGIVGESGSGKSVSMLALMVKIKKPIKAVFKNIYTNIGQVILKKMHLKIAMPL